MTQGNLAYTLHLMQSGVEHCEDHVAVNGRGVVGAKYAITYVLCSCFMKPMLHTGRVWE